MTPDKPDYPEPSEEFQITELYPFSAPVPDDALPDVPAMEQVPDPDALPDPGYPEMPAAPDYTNPDYARGAEAPEAAFDPADGFGVRSWPRPPVWPPATPPQSSQAGASQAGASRARVSRAQPSPGEAQPSPGEAESAGARPGGTARPVWSPDPYAAPRVPDDAPPLRGPAVPWSEVRAAADHEAAGEPLP
ncbi:MAG TPA: hypothetical protein VHF26_21725, partial [Trebonia sp.]|nr:hypothetical protein [Trebonia sp.]